MNPNVLLITVDQWRGDGLSAAGHPVLRTPTIDRLADSGVRFANHWANAAPCGPSRACLYTGTYLHHNRSIHNGTPLDARFTNVALLARQAGYDPVLFGYTDTSRRPPHGAVRRPEALHLRGGAPGLPPGRARPLGGRGSRRVGALAGRPGRRRPGQSPPTCTAPIDGYPGTDRHGSTWAPTRFSPEQSQTAFMAGRVMDWLERHGDRPFFLHASFIRPHPPRRNPPGYHDLYSADDVGPFVAAPHPGGRGGAAPLQPLLLGLPGLAAPATSASAASCGRPTTAPSARSTTCSATLFDYLEAPAWPAITLVVLTSDHGEMGGDHWLFEKLGYWDESYARAPGRRRSATGGRGGAGPGRRRVHRVGGRAPDHL